MKNILNSDTIAVLKLQQFRYFLSYRFVMTAATIMQSVIVGWHLYSITHDVLSLGMIGLTEVIPQISVSLFAGHFIDRWNRKKIIVYTSGLLLVGSAILFVYSIPFMHGYENFGTVPIFITIFITGLVRGILMPAHTALLGQLVPREHLTNASTLNSMNWQIAAMSGPAIGGLIYAIFGSTEAYLTVFIFYAFSVFLILQVNNIRPLSKPPENEGIFISIREGIKYVFKNKILLGAFSLDMFAVLFGGAVAVLPVFASDILKTGPLGLGILRACPSVGAMIMSVFLIIYPPMKNTGRTLFYCVAGFGLCMIAFAISGNMYLSGAVLILSGAFDNVSVIVRASVLQIFTPDEMKGRVASVNSIFIGSSNELGAFESGLAARLMGLIPSVIFGGTMTLLVVGAVASKSKVLRNLSLKDSR
jgi:MFS family permease